MARPPQISGLEVERWNETAALHPSSIKEGLPAIDGMRESRRHAQHTTGRERHTTGGAVKTGEELGGLSNDDER